MIRFILPLPPTLNKYERMNQFARNTLKTDFYAQIYLEIRSYFKEAVPDWGRIKVSYLIRSKRRPDVDNRATVCKVVNDGIVAAELVGNDTEDCMTYEFPSWEEYDGEPEVIIEITRLSELLTEGK